MNIIVLTGWKNSGKDTVAEHLEYKYDFIHFKFAKYLKQAANCIFPNIPLNNIELHTLDLKQELDYWEVDKDTPRKEFNGSTKRQVLVDLAKYLKSKYGDDIFVNSLNRELNLVSNNSKLVISDLRFQVEFEYLKQLNLNHNVLIVDIVNPNLKDNIEIYTEYAQIKTQLLKDNSLKYEVIFNEGSISDLHFKVDKLIEARNGL